MLNAEQLLIAEMKASPLNLKPKISTPGANPWTKYLIIGGIIGVSIIGAYLITRPKKNIKDGKEEN